MSEKKMDGVWDLVIPAAEFPVISEEASLREAILALDTAHSDFMAGKRKQRLLFVLDSAGDVIGKVSPKDVLKGLIPNYANLADRQAAKLPGDFDYLRNSRALQGLMEYTVMPWDDLCVMARDVKVKDFVLRPDQNQIVQLRDNLNKAIYRFILGRYDNLFVADDGKLVGMIQFADVYGMVLDRIKTKCVF